MLFDQEGDKVMQTPREYTLLELLQGVNQVTDNDEEVVAAVTALVNSGQVRLRGTFAGAKISVSGSLETYPKQFWPALLGLPLTS